MQRAVLSSRRTLHDWLDRPMTSVHLVLAIFVLLLAIGLMMVLSSSAITSYRRDGSSFTVFQSQIVFAGLGLVAFFFVLRMPLRVIRGLSTTAMLVALALLVAVLVPGISRQLNGSRSWIGITPTIGFQPSELAKLALLLWAAHVLAARRSNLGSMRALLIPLLPVAGLMAGLIMLQPDFGTTVTLAIVLMAVLYFAGAPLWIFAVVGGLGAAGLAALLIKTPYRLVRLQALLDPEKFPQSSYQLRQALYGMGNGGWFGVGLGGSRAKWSWLPNADSDFIFAIIGEELGLIGAFLVLFLFGLLAYTGMRIARRNVDPFVKIVAGSCTVWLVGQAAINIGYVVGLLPTTGLTLPMISAGGTSLVVTMIVFGLLANFARREPQAAAALHAKGPGPLLRFLGIGAVRPDQEAEPAKKIARRERRAAKKKAKGRQRAKARAQRLAAGPPPRKPQPRKPGPQPQQRRAGPAGSDPAGTDPAGSGPAAADPTGPARRGEGRPVTASSAGVSVLLAGGGTAGHIEPALAVADALRDADPGVTITALGTERGLETTLVPARGYELRLIPAVPLPRKPSLDLVKLPTRMRSAVRATRAVMVDRAVDVVVGFGGYVALPAYLAARRRVPIVVHEANARAGLANKIGARFATVVAAAVDGSGLPGARVLGIPVRRELARLDRAALRDEARRFFGLDPLAPTLLVFGGSQGAQRINEAVSGAADTLAAADIGVLHAHGRKNTLTLPDDPDPGSPPYVAVPYLDRMDLAYAAADLVLARSGAMTVAEVGAVGLPAVYVPLPHGNGEQRLNASAQVAAGAAIIIDDADLTPEAIRHTVIPLLSRTGPGADMAAAARVADAPDAGATLAGLILRLAAGRVRP